MCVHTHAPTRAHAHTKAHTHAQSYTPMHTLTVTRTRVRACAHAHTHTQTGTSAVRGGLAGQKGKKLSLAAVGLMLRLKALQERLPQPAALRPLPHRP